MNNKTVIANQELFKDISQLIEITRVQVSRTANSALVILYWEIGHRIYQDVLKNNRAKYGEEIIYQLAGQLRNQYGSGFDRYNLARMVLFVQLYPSKEIVVTVSQQLSWSHFIKLITIKDTLKRDFYTEMCRLQGWGVRELRKKIDGMLYERTAIAKQPKPIIKAEIEKLKQGELMNPDLYLQDPCVFNFLYPQAISSERDLETAILNELQTFIQEMGSDFCFVAKQKRMGTIKNDRFLDLLFFHRGMRRLIGVASTSPINVTVACNAL